MQGKKVPVLCLKFEKNDVDLFVVVFSYFWRHSTVESKSDRISGIRPHRISRIRLTDLPDIRPNQYPMGPYYAAYREIMVQRYAAYRGINTYALISR
jgi:hypothetical protein